VFGDRLEAAVSFATTEHFTLQTARVATVSEANGRASIYLAALSSNLIALAFIGQMSRLGAAFYAFALILLPVLAFVGVVTFQRLVQSSIEDIAYAQRVARLRAFYLDVAPGLEEFLLVVRGPPAEAPLHHESRRPNARQHAYHGGHGRGREQRGDRRLCGPRGNGSSDWLARRRAGCRSNRRGGDPVDTAPPPAAGK
jgi:hypothetical protein